RTPTCSASTGTRCGRRSPSSASRSGGAARCAERCMARADVTVVRQLPRLYAIVDPLDTGRDPVALAEAMLAGGARLLQVRSKGATSRDLFALAHAIAPRARR